MISPGSEEADPANPALGVLARSLKRSPEEFLTTLTTGTLEVPKVRVSPNLIDLLRSLKESGLDVKTFPIGQAPPPQAAQVPSEQDADQEIEVDFGEDVPSTS